MAMPDRERRAYEELRELEPRPFENTVLALDVDGVLIRPIAYRQAVISTITFFGEQLGVDPRGFMIEDRNPKLGRNMSSFEAAGIHDPWDVCAITVSLMRLKKEGVDVSNGEALEAFLDSSDPQSHPPDIILGWLKSKYRLETEVMQDITAFLSRTRDPLSNKVTSVFQEYVLGREIFEVTYDKPSLTGAEESLIRTRDQSLIDDHGRSEIGRISQQGGRVVVYTGRPGLPPPDVQIEPGEGYAPEAELAVARSKINPIGIVSMGSMEWLGRLTQTPVESLTKPNPTQALATILAALRERVDAQVLMDAYTWGQTGQAPQELQSFIGEEKKLELVVAEDSPSGIIAFINAKRILENQGINVKLTPIGIHAWNFEKYQAFSRLGREQGIHIITNPRVGEGITSYSYPILDSEN